MFCLPNPWDKGRGREGCLSAYCVRQAFLCLFVVSLCKICADNAEEIAEIRNPIALREQTVIYLHIMTFA